MVHDNPAERLLGILKKGQAIDAKATNCREAWKRILDTGNNHSLLMSRLGKAMDLPSQIINTLTDNYPDRGNTWSYWETQVNTAFGTQDLNGTWATFITKIDHHSMNYLGMTSDLLRSKSSTKLIGNNDLSAAREQIQNIYNEVLTSDIDSDVKNYLIRSLRKLLIEIDEYFLNGALPIADGIDMMIGHTQTDEKYLNLMRDTELGTRIRAALTDVASILTLVLGLPQLSSSFAMLLSKD